MPYRQLSYLFFTKSKHNSIEIVTSPDLPKDLIAERDKVAKKNTLLTDKCKKLVAKCKQLQKQQEDAVSEIQKALDDKSRDLEELSKELNDKAQELETAVSAKQVEVDAKTEELSHMESEKLSLEAQLIELKSELEEKEKNHLVACDNLSRTVSDQEMDIADRVAEVGRARDQAVDLQNQIEGLRSQLDAKDSAITDMEGERKELTLRLEQSQKCVSDLKEKLAKNKSDGQNTEDQVQGKKIKHQQMSGNYHFGYTHGMFQKFCGYTKH